MTSPFGTSQGPTTGASPSVPGSTNTPGSPSQLNSTGNQVDQTFINALHQQVQGQKINIDALKPPPTMQTLVYSPDVRVVITTSSGGLGGEYDVSKDLVSGTVIRKEDSVSSFVCTLANTDTRYNNKFNTMDRISVYMKRATWVQVFSGYLDLVPLVQLYPGTVQLQASCTLKRLLHTWWNPSLPASMQLFAAANSIQNSINGDGQGSVMPGSAFGDLLSALLVQVGGWSPSNVHVQNFPTTFLSFLDGTLKQDIAYNNQQTIKFQSMLEGTPSAGPGPYASQASLSVAATPGNAGFGAGPSGYTIAIIQSCDIRSLGPIGQNLQNQYGTSQAGLTGNAAMDQPSRQGWVDTQNIANTQILQTEGSDAAILGLACALAESHLMNQANQAVPDSFNFQYDGVTTTNTDIGLFNQDNSWGCLPGSAQILTTTGPVNIANINEGDEVWSFDGQQMKVAKVTRHMMTGHKPLLTIKTRGRELKITANHRIPVRRYFGVAEGRRPGNQYKKGTCGWETVEVSASEICRGDHLIIPHGMADGSMRTTPDGQDLTVGRMELAGLYLGDGNRDKGRIEISHAIDEDHMPHYRKVIEREFNIVPYSDSRGTRTRFSSSEAIELIDTGFSGTAGTKRLPGWVFRLAPELQLALLRGYLDSDGCVDRGRISYTSISKALIEDVRHLCICLGIPVGKIRLGRKAGLRTIRGRTYQCKDIFELSLTSTEHNHRISSNSPRKAAKFSTMPNQLRLRYDDDWTGRNCGNRKLIGTPPRGTVYHKVIAVEHEAIYKTVYDIEVAGPAHYVADGVIVHNSTAQRMTPFNAAGLFYDALNKIDWRNMDPAYAIATVQGNQGASATYASFIEQARTTVQGYRAGQGQFTPDSIAGIGPSTVTAGVSVPGVGGSVGGGLNAPSSSAPAAAAAAIDATQGPTPNSEGAINYAMSKLGSVYHWGGAGPNSFDCSGLWVAAFQSIGIWLPHDAASQTQQHPVPPSAAFRGCLMNPPGETGQGEGGHVVMYLGNGQILECTGPEGQVGVQLGSSAKYGPLSSYGACGYVCQNGGQNPAALFNAAAVGGPDAGVPGTAGNSGAAGSGAVDEPIARNLFSQLFMPGQFVSPTADLFTGEKAFIDDQPLIQMVQAVTKSGLRSFQSAPNGDFIAYYPDYFGLDGHPVNYVLEDIEMKDVRIDLSDDPLTTHVYVCGDWTQMGNPGTITSMLQTAGVATVENTALWARLAAAAPGTNNTNLSGQQLMQRYGVRPLNANYANAGSAELEFLLACQVFTQKWAEQYKTRVSITFMPELFPGMRVRLSTFNIIVYVAEVYHQFDFESGGFNTEIVIMAPSAQNAQQNVEGVNIGLTPTNTSNTTSSQGPPSGLLDLVNNLPFANNSFLNANLNNPSINLPGAQGTPLGGGG